MFLRIAMISVVASVLASGIAAAQVPAGAPAGSTGLCKDGTYSSSATKRGACSGHKGVQTWYAADGASAPAAAAPASAATPAAPATAPAAPAPAPAAAAPKETSKPLAAQAAGGGPGLVWVNTNSKVYHCQAD